MVQSEWAHIAKRTWKIARYIRGRVTTDPILGSTTRCDNDMTTTGASHRDRDDDDGNDNLTDQFTRNAHTLGATF